MRNKLTNKEEENIGGFTGDIKDFLRKGDFKSAQILVGDLKKYITEIRKLRVKKITKIKFKGEKEKNDGSEFTKGKETRI